MHTIDVTYECWSYHKPLDDMAVHSPQVNRHVQIMLSLGSSYYSSTSSLNAQGWGLGTRLQHKWFVHIISHTHLFSIHQHIRVLSILIPRSFHHPVFDCLQYAKTEG